MSEPKILSYAISPFCPTSADGLQGITIDAQRQQGNLSSALRLFVLDFYRSQIPEVEGREGLREMLERPKPLLS